MLYLAGQILVFVAAALVIGVLLAWVFLIGPMRRQSEEARRALAAVCVDPAAARPSVANGRVDGEASEVGRSAVGDVAADGDAGTEGLTDRDMAVGSAVLVAEMRARLRRQDDEWALEKAALTARLTAAEQRAAESEQRVTAVERQVLAAGRRVRTIEGALAEAEAHERVNRQTSVPVQAAPVTRAALQAAGSPNGSSAAVDTSGGADLVATRSGQTHARGDAEAVQTLAAEAARLRVQLSEAEGRAAKFSSRLAMARTEAEDAQRQVATMTTKLDRHQAEWAAEKVRLLARIEGDERSGHSERSEDAAGPGHAPAERVDAPASRDDAGPGLTHDADADGNGGADADGGSTADSEWADDFPFDGRDPALVDVVPVQTARPVPGEPPGQPQAVLPGSVALASLTAAGGAGAFSVAIPAEVTGTRRDNLKEIVGIGPVVEARLYALGIASFRQLAELDSDQIDGLVRVLDGFGDRLFSDDWVGQARSLYERHHGNVA
ncbi:hypothetical protein [Frankia sp. CiP3]|uniref:hypothetical protein n=1 Tax=Frankia sp. CiP3 TaxID=2880971 RepID=UPI001EF41FCA|nr:hypothetical protein [Frankia sp. CiP3]